MYEEVVVSIPYTSRWCVFFILENILCTIINDYTTTSNIYYFYYIILFLVGGGGGT